MSLEQLRALLTKIEQSQPRAKSRPRVRAVSAERKLGEEQTAALIERYSAGASANALSKEFGVPAASIMRLVRKHGLEVHVRLPSGETVAKAAELYESRLSLQRVADQLLVPKSSIRRALLDAGFTLRPKNAN